MLTSEATILVNRLLNEHFSVSIRFDESSTIIHVSKDNEYSIILKKYVSGEHARLHYTSVYTKLDDVLVNRGHHDYVLCTSPINLMDDSIARINFEVYNDDEELVEEDTLDFYLIDLKELLKIVREFYDI